MGNPDLIGSTEACAVLGIDRATLTRRIQAGKLAPLMKLPGPNGPYIFERSEVTRHAVDIASRHIERERLAEKIREHREEIRQLSEGLRGRPDKAAS